MSLVTLSVQHGHPFDEARSHLETAVTELVTQFGTLVKRVEWSADRNQVRLEGRGFWIDLRLDEHAVHMSADIPVLGRFLGGSVTKRVQELLRRTFQQQLPRGKENA